MTSVSKTMIYNRNILKRLTNVLISFKIFSYFKAFHAHIVDLDTYKNKKKIVITLKRIKAPHNNSLKFNNTYNEFCDNVGV